MLTLFHYTCGTASAAIRDAGFLAARPHDEFAGTPLLWLTDVVLPGRQYAQWLGLRPHFVDAHRTLCHAAGRPCELVSHRFTVLTAGERVSVWPFKQLAEDFPAAAEVMARRPLARPETWFFTTAPIRIVR